MRILPVIDLMNGVVVRAVAGRRHEYRPIVSRLTPSVQPLDIAQTFRDQFGLSEIYLADLDAIAGKPPSLSIIVQLLKNGFLLRVDAGIGENQNHIRSLADVGVQHFVAGLESLEGPGQLAQLLEGKGSSRVIFSLDLRHGRPLAKNDWSLKEPCDIAAESVRMGVQQMLVLDLAAVGANQGTPTDLCERLRAAYPRLEICTGGGVRDVGDLRRLSQIGIDGALVASALHDGRLTPDDIRVFTR